MAAAAAAAGAAGFGGVGADKVEAAFSGGVFASGCTEPDGVVFTPPGTGVESAVGAGGTPSGGGEGGDLVSSGITANAQTSGVQSYGENDNFYQLELTVSTR